MTLHRRLLFYSFILFFFAGGTYLLFTAQGYRYSIKKNTIELTGEITIDSRPNGATVTLDGAPPLTLLDTLVGKTAVATPARIQSLLSGEYRITLSRGGYYPWTIPVTILPGKAAVLSNVTLLPKGSFQNERVDANMIQIAANASTILARTSDHRVLLYDRRSKASRELFRSQGEPLEQLSASPSNTMIVLIGESHVWVFPFNSPDFSKPISRGGITKIGWSQGGDLFALSPRGIFVLRQKTRSFVPIMNGRFRDIAANTRLAVLDGEGAFRLFSINNPLQPTQVFQMKKGADAIASMENGIVALRVIGKNGLELISELKPSTPPRRIAHSQSIRWIDSHSFFVWDDFEISSGSTSDVENKLSLVTRQSQPLRAVYSHPSSPAVFFLTQAGSVFAQDLRTKDPKNLYSIVDGSHGSIRSIALVGKELVSAVSKDGVSGFIRIPLAE